MREGAKRCLAKTYLGAAQCLYSFAFSTSSHICHFEVYQATLSDKTYKILVKKALLRQSTYCNNNIMW